MIETKTNIITDNVNCNIKKKKERKKERKKAGNKYHHKNMHVFTPFVGGVQLPAQSDRSSATRKKRKRLGFTGNFLLPACVTLQ